MTTFIQLPVENGGGGGGGGGSAYWKDAVATSSALGVGTVDGEVKLVLNTNKTYRWNGGSSTWEKADDYLGALTGGKAVISTAQGVTESVVTSLELSQLQGCTGNVQTSLDNKLPLTGGTIVGNLFLNTTTPSTILEAAAKGYVDTQVATATTSINTKVSKSGDTMTGLLTLSGAPTTNLHAATKLYVDTAANLKVNKAGDTMTGNLAMSANFITGLASPVNSNDAANKIYVDNQDALKVAKNGDTMTGFLTLNADPTSALHSATKQYVDAADSTLTTSVAAKVSKSGDTMTGFLTLSADPTSALHAATKQYVDAVAQGLDVKSSVKAATTANITLSGTQTIDTVALVAGDRCLVKNQTAQAENGIYVVSATAWSRSTDMDNWLEVPGAFTFVEQGSQGDTGWVCTSNQGGTLGTTAIIFTQFSGAGSYTADGQGIELVGNQFQLELDGTTLSKSATGVKVADGGITNTQVNASAAVAFSKMAALTASRALTSDVSGVVSVSAVTSTELGYVSGVTSAIQTQLNGKQATGNYVTALTGDVTASGPGSAAATVANVGGKTAAQVATSVNDTVAATNASTASTIMKRDASGNVNVKTLIAETKAMVGANATPAASAALEISSTTGALLMPRMTTAQRDALTGVNGMIIYNSSTNLFEGFVSGAWTPLHGWGY